MHTCFYPGIDTYHKTWLQFAFPLLSRAMRVFGRNNVAILATLFLLSSSYSKLLKTIITVLSSSSVWVSQGDGSGGGGGVMGTSFSWRRSTPSCLVLLFLPYTLLLTFGQCLCSASLRRRWVRRLVQSTAFVSILDAYHAPYQRRHHYWTGLMLLTRCGLFLAFATFQSDIIVPANVFVTSLTVSTILLYKTLASKVSL